MSLPVEDLTEKSDIRRILKAIWRSTETMMDEYILDGKIGEVVLANREQAWEWARKEALRVAREKTGRKLPEN